MARVIGPMFCTWASGTFGKTFTCYYRKGQHYMAKKRSHFIKPKGMALFFKHAKDKERKLYRKLLKLMRFYW
ncbi:MAG: hypothetical protein DRP09_15380 [Candidatus Thorarchaeota archaeon]|nr:MAG: hypothetical protein DRP09_15380 [Candidatus Thorarchaeota archaeon]